MEYNHNGVLPLIKKDIDENDSQARILRVLIKLNKPLRAFEIVETSGMNKTRVHNNLNLMVAKGLILMKEDDLFHKCYYPQEFFLLPDIMTLLYEKIIPFINIIHDNTDYSQMEESDNRKVIIENIKVLLRMFAYEIDDFKNKY